MLGADGRGIVNALGVLSGFLCHALKPTFYLPRFCYSNQVFFCTRILVEVEVEIVAERMAIDIHTA